MSATPQPNVLVLCSDQHQAGAAGCYGNSDVRTPHIDGLAARGVRFTHAYCQAPVCTAARASIITGLYPDRHGVHVLSDALSDEVPTIAHQFARSGYQTAAIGKMHFVDESLRHGFDYRVNEADFRASLTKGRLAEVREDHAELGSVTGRPSALSESLFQDSFFAEETARFLRERGDRPFLLWSSFFKPHTPLNPAAAFWEMYDPESLTLPERRFGELEGGFEGHLIRARERGWYDQTDEDLSRSLAGYYGNVTQMDAYIGRVLNTLDACGLGENTIVVYTSDHGEMAGAHRMWTKHSMYEQSVRVPLIIALPNGSYAGAVREQLIEHVDLWPTLAELCGLEGPEEIQGRSFASTLGRPHSEHRETVFSQYDFCSRTFTQDDRYVGKPPMRMIRSKRWKLVDLSWDRSELYDLATDSGEWVNRVEEQGSAKVVKDFGDLLEDVGQGRQG